MDCSTQAGFLEEASEMRWKEFRALYGDTGNGGSENGRFGFDMEFLLRVQGLALDPKLILISGDCTQEKQSPKQKRTRRFIWRCTDLAY